LEKLAKRGNILRPVGSTLPGHGVPIRRVISGGGFRRRTRSEVTSLGAAVFALLAAGTFRTIEEAQEALCPAFDVVEPDPRQVETYARLFPLYRQLYFALGRQGSSAVEIGQILPSLRRIAADARQS
jgi:L-ribulokinase